MSSELDALYPFLRAESPADLADALASSVSAKVADHAAVVEAFFATQSAAVVAAAHTLAGVFRGGGRLFTAGNGGSSCDAAHVAVEFMHPVTAGRPALPAHDLGADSAMLSAVANDVGFGHVQVRQLAALARPGDALLGLSTSGSSANLLAAFERAKRLGMVTIGLCGTGGGAMASAGLDHCLVVPSDSVHRIQEVHTLVYHLLWDLVHTSLAADRGGP
jgi:D-sedoheptulose 7-phosphate isomerase